MFCKICQKEIDLDSANFVLHHLKKVHNTTSKEYYDQYFKNDGEGICLTCGKLTKFYKLSKGYAKYCSSKCSNSNKNKIKKTCKTWQKTLGVDFPAQSVNVYKKIKATCLERYGVENYSKTFNFKKDYEKTCLEKYGTPYHLSNKDIRLKIEQTNLEKYGTSTYVESNDFKLNMKLQYFKHFCINLNDYEVLSDFDDFLKKNITVKCLLCGLISTYDISKIKCNCQKRFNSKYEREIYDWLLSLDIKNIKINERFPKYEIDLYLPEYKLGIEFNGLFWHNDLIRDKNYHLNKTMYFKKLNINIIHIFENEWLNKKDIVKSIIKNKLKLNKTKIYARKCQIRDIKYNEYLNFLYNNHISYAKIAPKIKLGLFYNDELVSIIGIGKSRFKKNEYEIIRFCNKLNTNIIGGFRKFLKYIENNYSYIMSTLVSYCDIRYFDGNSYNELFNFVSQTKPNYYYFKCDEMILYNRMTFQKHKLKNLLENFDSNLTEEQNMSNNGYLRIWDCGNLKFMYKGKYNENFKN